MQRLSHHGTVYLVLASMHTKILLARVVLRARTVVFDEMSKIPAGVEQSRSNDRAGEDRPGDIGSPTWKEACAALPLSAVSLQHVVNDIILLLLLLATSTSS